MAFRQTLSALILGAGLLYGATAYAGEPKVVGGTYTDPCDTAAAVEPAKKKVHRKSCADLYNDAGMCFTETVADSLGATESTPGYCPGKSNTQCYNTNGIPNLSEELGKLGVDGEKLKELSQTVDDLDGRVTDLEEDLDEHEIDNAQKIGSLENRTGSLEKRTGNLEGDLSHTKGRLYAVEKKTTGVTIEGGLSAVYSPETNTFGAEAEIRVLGGNTVRAGMYANGSWLKEEQTSVNTEPVIPGLNQTTTETETNQRIVGVGPVVQFYLGSGFSVQGKVGAAYNLRELERNIQVGKDSIDVGRKENRVVGEAAVGVNCNIVGPFGIGVEARGNTDKNYSVEGGLYLTF